MKNALILCSGGIDSVVTSFYVRKVLRYENITLIFFNYSQRSIIQERKFSKECSKNINAGFIELNIDNHKSLNCRLTEKYSGNKKITLKRLIDSNQESEKWYVPMRNSLFIVYSMAYAESMSLKFKGEYDIFIGFKNEGKESYPDTTKEYLNIMNELSKKGSYKKSRIIAPFIEKDKEDIITLGKNLGVDFKKTYSCYISRGRSFLHCGTCIACRLRQEGFYWADIKDPTLYNNVLKDFRTGSRVPSYNT